MRSKFKGVFWRVEIHEQGFVGESEEMVFDGASPLEITWEQRGDEFYIAVKGSEATINIKCFENFKYLSLFTSDPRKYRVSIYRNTKLYWRGYTVADLYSESFTAPPYQVNIKAIDGFSLLKNIPLADEDNEPLSGRKSLWELISKCIELLELDVDVADWLDLYAEGMTQQFSPLRQTYIDLDQLYVAKSEPTFRDLLELCLQPFAAQIFQSNGALHIRRAVSLYNNTRPLSFYNISTEVPSGWLVAADGRTLITTSGEPIITEATRERIESMWENDINVQSESTLEISPALRMITVDVENVLQDNLLYNLGVFNGSEWTNANNCISSSQLNSLTVIGNDDNQGNIMLSRGVMIESCSTPMTLKFTPKAGYYKVVYGLGGGRPSPDYSVTLEIAFTIRTSDNRDYFLSEDGRWQTEEYYMSYTAELISSNSINIEIKGFNIEGLFRVAIKQTLSGWDTSVGKYEESCTLEEFSLSIDDNTIFEDALHSEFTSNPGNNLDMAITLPIADIAQLPNNPLLYALYCMLSDGTPTAKWKERDTTEYLPLIQHIVKCAKKYKENPSRIIQAEMFTGKHIDMNTVVQDDKYLRTAFYVNSIELKCLEDCYNSELVEMPNLIHNA